VPSSRARVPAGAVRIPTSRHWTQSFPFSCGPAALGSMLTALGWRGSRGRLEEELALWREATAVACPGAHPLGLAVAARRRGFSTEVRIEGPRPWLNEHIRSAHRWLPPRSYARVERYLLRECEDLGISVRWGAAAPLEAHAALLLVSENGAPAAEPDPHWIGLVPSEDGVWVSDPLRRRPYPTRRSVRDWWDVSGYQGTKSCVGLWRGDARDPKPRSPNSAHDPGPRRSRSVRQPGHRDT
jgi:hypothetical protein